MQDVAHNDDEYGLVGTEIPNQISAVELADA